MNIFNQKSLWWSESQNGDHNTTKVLSLLYIHHVTYINEGQAFGKVVPATILIFLPLIFCPWILLYLRLRVLLKIESTAPVINSQVSFSYIFTKKVFIKDTMNSSMCWSYNQMHAYLSLILKQYVFEKKIVL